MPESGTYGSVRGAPSNGRPYRNALPIPDSRESEDRTFAATVRCTEAVVQITRSFSFTWRALRQLGLVKTQKIYKIFRR
jgi:hypothetical protein